MRSRLLVVATGMAAHALLVAAPPAWAQAVRLTMDEAIARSLETSHRLAELDARVEAGRARVDGAEAIGRPLVAAIGGYTRTNHIDEFGVPQPDGSIRIIFPDIPDNYRGRLDLQWPIYTAGRADALAHAARSEVAAAGDELRAARADLRLEVTRAFWALVTARHTVRVFDEALRRTDAHLRDVRNRLDAGLVAPNDVLTAEARRARQEVQLIEARNVVDAATADLGRLTGLRPGTPIEPDAALTAGRLPAEPDAALVEEAQAARAERAAIEHRVEAAGAQREAAGAGARPQVSVIGGVDYARPNPRILPRRAEWDSSWDLGVTLSWSLWDGGRVKAHSAEASAVERAARERLREFDRTLAADVPQRRLDLASGLAAIRAAEVAVRSAAEARRVVDERFRAGVATSTDVLDAQVELLAAELDYTRAIANSRLAEARLTRVLGR